MQKSAMMYDHILLPTTVMLLLFMASDTATSEQLLDILSVDNAWIDLSLL